MDGGTLGDCAVVQHGSGAFWHVASCRLVRRSRRWVSSGDVIFIKAFLYKLDFFRMFSQSDLLIFGKRGHTATDRRGVGVWEEGSVLIS